MHGHGLVNFGRTCYINSIVQILLNTPDFCELLREYQVESETDSNCAPLSNRLIDLAAAYFRGHAQTTQERLRLFVIEFLTRHREFADDQQDQHEYLTFLFDRLHNEQGRASTFNIVAGLDDSDIRVKLEKSALEQLRLDGLSVNNRKIADTPYLCYDSPVFRLFTGQYHSRTECRACMHVYHRFDVFTIWELPIHGSTLESCITQYTSIEKLDAEIECDKCKARTKPCKRITLWRTPEILVINLKRHCFDQTRSNSTRCNTTVTIPLELDVTPYMSIDRKVSGRYELYATGNHIGDANRGHCYSVIKNDGKWYLFNDETVHQTQINLENNDQYLLFYRRIN